MQMVTRRTTQLAALTTMAASMVCLGVTGGQMAGASPFQAQNATQAKSAAKGSTATIDMGSAPDSLDPQFGYTTEAAEADWITYTPLLTYAHKSGAASTKVIPGLATSYPKVTDNGLVYTLTLRPGLKFSDGTPVVASDFTFAIERLFKLNWGGDSFFSDNIQGAAAYLAGKAKTISGITTNDTTGKITIKLVAPYGAFENVLAFPSAAPVPPTTPMKVLTDPPPGVGAYIIKDVVPNVSFELVKNPYFASFHIPGIPVGHLATIKVSIVSNSTTEAEQVLDNQVDNFDTFDTIPSSLLGEIKSQAADRFTMEPSETTDYFFLNESKAPFNNKLAREAVNYAVNRDAFVRLASGSLTPGCYLLPPGMVGHPKAPCPYGAIGTSNVAKAKALIKQAHLVGAPVTVWGEQTSPVGQFVQYYASVLNRIGFKATIKFVTGANYFPTVGSRTADPQTGWSAWAQDFPNPIDFYLLVNANSIQPVGNRNRSYVRDPHIQAELKTLGKVTTSNLQSVASQWTSLDEYVARQADELIIGYPEDPKFMSDAINFRAAAYSLINGNDWSTWELAH